MPPILIRPARIDDAQGMIDVINPIIRAGGATAIESEFSLDAQREFIRTIGPRETCLLAINEATGGILGFQGYALHPALPANVADIATFVRISQKSRGIGRLLSKAVFEAARRDGFSEINATIRADNFEGLNFYTKIGFRDHSVERAKPLKCGKIVDRISKRRVI